MGQLSAILAPAPSFPSQLTQNPGSMRTLRGTKHSISACDITAVSSAVSACAINSVAERVDCLCRKYLTPDPEPWEKPNSFSWEFCGELYILQFFWHKTFLHARAMVVCLNCCLVFILLLSEVGRIILCSAGDGAFRQGDSSGDGELEK